MGTVFRSEDKILFLKNKEIFGNLWNIPEANSFHRFPASELLFLNYFL